MEHNRVVELGSLIKPAKTIRCGDDYYPVLSMTMHDGLVFQEEKFKKEVASKNKADYKVVFKNQLVVGFPIDEGVLATQRIVDAGIVSPAYGIWDVDQSKIHPEFLEWALRSARALDYYRAKLRGSTARRRSLPTETFLKFTLPLPSISEQMHILDIIHKLQVMLRSRQQQLAKLDELVKARFVETFGDSEYNTKHWPVVKLSDICEVGSSKRIYKNEQSSSGVPFLRISDLNERIDGKIKNPEIFISIEKYDELKLQGMVPIAGDVLVTSRGTLGRCYIVTEEDVFYFQDGMISWLSKIDARAASLYLSYLFSMRGIQKQIETLQAGSTVAYLSITMLKKLDIMLPPPELQRRFLSFAEQIDKLKLSIKKSLEQMETLKKALMQQYFG